MLVFKSLITFILIFLIFEQPIKVHAQTEETELNTSSNNIILLAFLHIQKQKSTDTDSDGVYDYYDVFPNDPLEQSDLDKDGVGDNSDIDIDGDGFKNDVDDFPLDPLKNKDTNNIEAPVLEIIPTFSNVAVHDPSVIKTEDNTYYIFGSHLGVAKSTDLKNWSGVAQSPNVATSPLFNTYLTEAKEGIDWAWGEIGSWAADVIKLNDGRYYFYYNHCGDCGNGTSRSYLGVAVADNIEGPYKNLGLIFKTGQTNNDNPNTDIEGDAYTPDSDPNAIDPDVFWDNTGRLWMTYGSYSGGIFIIELDPNTGFPLKNYTYGTHIAGGHWSAIEGTHILYSPISEYYYLFMSFGGFAQNDGYNMRIARSKQPDGPYFDSNGNNMIYAQGGWNSITKYGNKIMGGFNFVSELGMSGNDYGYMSPGHGSAIYDSELQKHLLFFHTRFPNRGEHHEVRVHEMYLTEDEWLVPLPHRYFGTLTGEDIVTSSDFIGTYQYINHGKDINRTVKKSSYLKFDDAGNVNGDLVGTYILDKNQLTITTTTGSIYKAVSRWQWNANEKKLVPVFSAINEEGIVIWGSRMPVVDIESAVKAIADSLSFNSTITSNLNLPTQGLMGASINWSSSNSEVVKETGEVYRPAEGSQDVNVTLTALISLEGFTLTKTFEITVLAETSLGLIAHFTFDNTLSDSKGHLDDGITTGRTWQLTGPEAKFSTGLFSTALSLDGNYGISLPTNLITNNSYTISYWVKPKGKVPTYTTTFFGGNDGADNEWVSYVPTGPSGVSGRTTLWFKTNNTYYDGDTGQNIPSDAWSHLAFVVNQGNVEVYVNGDLAWSGNNFPDLFSTQGGDFLLGVNYFSQDPLFVGLIDQLKAFDKALSSAEILELYQEAPQ